MQWFFSAQPAAHRDSVRCGPSYLHHSRWANHQLYVPILMATGRSFAVWWSETQAVFAWSQFRRTGSNYSTRPKKQKWNMMSCSVSVWMRLVTPGFTTMSSQHQSLNLKQKSLSKWQISDSLTWKMWQRTGPGPWCCCAGRRQSNAGKEKRKIRKKWPPQFFSYMTTYGMIFTPGALFWWSKSDTAEGPIHVCSASDGVYDYHRDIKKQCLNVESIYTTKEWLQSLLKYHGKNVVFDMTYLTQKHKIHVADLFSKWGRSIWKQKSTIGFRLTGFQFIITANQRKCLGIYFDYTEFFLNWGTHKHSAEGENKKGENSSVLLYPYPSSHRKDEQDTVWSFPALAEALCFTAHVNPK